MDLDRNQFPDKAFETIAEITWNSDAPVIKTEDRRGWQPPL
jgi:hypothetical protein